MKDFRHLVVHIKKYGRQHEALYFLALMILFWSVFDGMTTYITPLIMAEAGMTKTLIGLIIGSSSVFGAGFDFLMCKLFKHGHFRQIFMLMFGLCFAYIGVLYLAKSVALFVLAMALWGVYYDLKNFGSFDFVSRFVKADEHTSSFGVLSVFQAVGYLLAPIMVGLLIGQTVGWWPFAAAAIFLAIAGLFLLRLLGEDKKLPETEIKTNYNYKGFFQEIKLWLKIDRVLLPVLLMMMTVNIIDAFFWTIGPILAESFKDIHPMAGLFMTAYTLPPLLVGWLVGGATVKLGKKRTSYFALLLGSLILSLMKFIDQSIIIILDVFMASFFIAFSWPAIKATFADYIKETERYEKEIEGLVDFYTNLGFVFGPIMAGIIADQVGIQNTFGVLGMFGVVMALMLFKITPRKINVLKAMGGPGGN
ncbi:MAG: MFS transporter [Patescibacteria group bacterium]|nr:MFS transporter [Patescibacteria group bacterium]